MTTATETTTVTYLSKSPNQILIYRAQSVLRNLHGQTIDNESGIKIEFDHNRATIEPAGAERVLVNGRRIEVGFDALTEWLEKHPKFKTAFWRMDDAPDEPEPTIGKLKELIAEADLEELRALYGEERSTHNRPMAVTLLTDAIVAATATPQAPPAASDSTEDPEGSQESEGSGSAEGNDGEPDPPPDTE